MDRLGEMPGTGAPHPGYGGGGGQGRENRLQPLEVLLSAADGDPVPVTPALYPPLTPTSRNPMPRAASCELRAAGAGLPPVTVPPVSDEVTRVEQAGEVIHDLTGCSSGGQHQPHRPGSGKVLDHRGQRASSPHARAAGLVQDIG